MHLVSWEQLADVATGKGPSVNVDILPITIFLHLGEGFGACSFAFAREIIDGTPHNLYAARMHGARSACNQNSTEAGLDC